jgi:hypothetical protein
LHRGAQTYQDALNFDDVLESVAVEVALNADRVVVFRRWLPAQFDEETINQYVAGTSTPSDTFQDVASRSVDGVEPMPLPEFWAVVDGGAALTAGGAIASLRRLLVKSDTAMILAFELTLRMLLRELDSPELLEAGRSLPAAVPLSADSGLYFRCAIVLDGQVAVSRALFNPSQAFMVAKCVDAEGLLSVSSDAWRTVANERVYFESEVSYETGSNKATWGGETRGVEPAACDVPLDDDIADYEAPDFEWCSVRVFLKSGDHFEEVLSLFRATPPAPYQPVEEALVVERGQAHAVAIAHTSGSELVACETEALSTDTLFDMVDVFWAERRWAGGATAFVNFLEY